MLVLVTGGTGVVGTATVRQLLERGHRVRLFSRHATHDREQWPDGVEAVNGSVAEADKVRGTADGVDAVVHVAGIVAESPPEVTFEAVNVEGTRLMLEEARRAGVRRFVYVSSLGAERGSSDYHKSKHRAEKLVSAAADLDWVVLRPGNVYGPGDEVVSLLLQMVRALPAVPVIDDGDQPFQPIAADDTGLAVAMAVERDDVKHRTLDLAGAERTSMNALLDEFARITGKTPARLPLPGWLASTGTKLASLFGVDMPVGSNQITMLVEGNVIPPGGTNALTDVFGITPTPLSIGLAKLADDQPELLPSEGVGRLTRRRYWADIAGSGLTPEALFDRFRERFAALAPSSTVGVGAEPGTPTALDEGATLTLALPMRGNVQVRVLEVEPRSLVLVTLAGHPLAGVNRFLTEQRGDLVRFEVQTYDRSANVVDLLAMSTIGRVLKSQTWTTLVENVVKESGGQAADGVHTESESLDDEQAERIERWAETLVTRRKREEAEEEIGSR